MKNKLCQTIGEDLNIIKYHNESHAEFNQRLIYSAAGMWVRTLIFGNDFSNDEQIYPDILYVQMRLAKVIEGFTKCLDLNIDWINEDTLSDFAKKFAGMVIQDMIYVHDIAEIDERKICHVPRKDVIFGSWVRLKGNNTFNKIIYSFGISQWSMAGNNMNVQSEINVINHVATNYIQDLVNNLVWSQIDSLDNYSIFVKGVEHNYSKCWKPFVSNQVEDGVHLLKENSQFNGGYMLLNKKNQQLFISTLDPWYLESKEIYRIMYALNKDNNTPAVFRVKDYDDYKVVFLASALPEYESRLLISISWPYREYNDKYARIIPNDVYDLVEELINKIGAKLIIQ